MTPCEERGWKVGDLFVVKSSCGHCFTEGSIIELDIDDSSEIPRFSYNGKQRQWVSLSDITPLSTYFQDIDNPTVKERLMFELKYGFDPFGENDA